MKLLVVGSGGREHAIAKKLLESKDVEQVFVAPGNDGMTLDGLDLINIGISEHSKLIDFAKANDIAWTFIGPDDALAGVVHSCRIDRHRLCPAESGQQQQHCTKGVYVCQRIQRQPSGSFGGVITAFPCHPAMSKLMQRQHQQYDHDSCQNLITVQVHKIAQNSHCSSPFQMKMFYPDTL